MTDDKAKASGERDGLIEIGIRTEPVPLVVCPGCGVEIETHEVPSFTEIACPHCRTRQTVPAKLANFRLLHVIGAGGMGAVFLAQDDTLNRRVAIKVMQSSIGEDPAVLATFRREAQSAARLNHPNVVQIYSFGEEKGQPYLVMELVSGDKLDEIIEAGEPLDPAFVMRVGMEVAEGLYAAHAANLVHGDIKPENVLFDERMQAKLVDFGIASMLSSKDSGDEVWGTPFYIAPEKAQRRKADVRSDIYSLGATLYHAVAGRPPFDGEDAVAVIRARFEGPAKSLAELRPGIEPQVVAIIERMMQNDLFLRYPNYTSLLKDMRKYLEGVPETRKAGPQHRKARLRRAASAGIRVGDATPLPGTPGIPTSPVRNASGDLAASSAAAATPTGRRGFVIQKGSISAAAPLSNSTLSSTPVAATNAPSEPGRRSPSPKTVAILVLVFFGVLLLAGVGVLVSLVAKSQGKEKELDALFVKAQTLEAEMPALDGTLAAAVARVAERDAEAGKVLSTAGELVSKALGRALVVPDLEPPPPAPPEAPAGGTPTATANPTSAVPAAADAATNAVPAGVAAAEGVPEPAVDATAEPALEPVPALEPAPAPEPATAPAMEDRPALMLRAEALFGPARQIRAKLRQAEVLRDRPSPSFGVLKREAMAPEQWKVRNEFALRRKQDALDIDGLAKDCDALLLQMRRAIPGLEKEAAGLLEAARSRAEAERQAKERAEAEAARQRSADEVRERAAREEAYVQSAVQQRRALVDKFDYTRVSKELERIRPELATEGGKAALESAIEQFVRLASLKAFLIRDLHENKGLRGGLGPVDVVDADATGLVGVGGRSVAWSDLTIPQWINLIVKLLENRPKERDLRAIEHGEQLFNAAIFCVVHGGGATSAEAKALTLVKLALQRRTALRPEVPRLLPSLADKSLE